MSSCSADELSVDQSSEEDLPSTVDDHMKLLDQFASRLVHCLDIESGLLEKLVADKVITHHEKRQIIKDNLNPIDVLIELLKTKSKQAFETFLEKLKNDDQCHVYNLLMGIDDDNDRPLTESELEMFDKCVLKLREELDIKNGLLNNLFTYRCINKVHSQRIVSSRSECDGAQELLDILRMRSIRDFRSFAKALTETNQKHLVDILKTDGVIVDVKVHADNAENGVLTLLQETLAIVERDRFLVRNAAEFENGLQQFFSNHVIGVNNGCICISLFCADSDATRKVLRYVYQGSFRVDLERWATSRLLGAEVRITVEPMTELHRSLLTSCTVRLDVELDSPTRAQRLRQSYRAARSAVVLHCSSAPDARLQISGMKTDGTSSLQLLVYCQNREDEKTLNAMHSDGSLKAAVRQMLMDVTNGKPVGEFHVAIRKCWLSTNPQSLPVEMLDLILFKTARRIFLRCPMNKRFLRTNERELYGTMASVCHHWRNSLNDKWMKRRFRGVYNEYIRQRIENRRSEVRDCLSLSDEKLMNVLPNAIKVTQLQLDAIKSATNDARQCDELLTAVYNKKKCRQLLKVLAESDQSNVHALILSESISRLFVETKESTPHDDIAKNLNSALRYVRHESQQTTKSLDGSSSSSSSGDGGGKTHLPIVDETLTSLRVFVNDLKPAQLLYVRAVNDGSLEILVGCHPAKESQTGLFEAYDRSEEDRKLKPMLNSIFDSLLEKMSASPSKRRLSIARVKLDKDSFKSLSVFRRESRKRKQLQHTFSSVDDTEMGLQLKREHTLTPSSEETMTDVTGLAYLDGRLFIAHRSSNTLTVRDARAPDDVVGSVRLPEGCHLYDIVACPKSHCLYISDSRPNNGCIWKISADGGTCTAWSTSVRHPRGLSVSADGSLLVVSEAPHGVVYIFRASDNEKSTCDDHSPSTLLDLPDDIDSPRRALQLSNGNIVVCFGGADHAAENQGVCLLSQSGDLLLSLLSKKIIKPYIELDRKERIIIADDRNNRVIRVTVPTVVPTAETDETTLTEILVSFNAATADKRSGPCRVCLPTDDSDAELSRLFVGLRDGTVLAFRYVDDSNKSISSSSSSSTMDTLLPVDKETVA